MIVTKSVSFSSHLKLSYQYGKLQKGFDISSTIFRLPGSSNLALGIRAMAIWRVLADLQGSILQGQQISFWHSPPQSLDLQIYIFQIIWTCMVPYLNQLQYAFKKNKVGLRHTLNTFSGVWGLPDKTKN